MEDKRILCSRYNAECKILKNTDFDCKGKIYREKSKDKATYFCLNDNTGKGVREFGCEVTEQLEATYRLGKLLEAKL